MATQAGSLLRRPAALETEARFHYAPRQFIHIDTVGKNRKGPIAALVEQGLGEGQEIIQPSTEDKPQANVPLHDLLVVGNESHQRACVDAEDQVAIRDEAIPETVPPCSPLAKEQALEKSPITLPAAAPEGRGQSGAACTEKVNDSGRALHRASSNPEHHVQSHTAEIQWSSTPSTRRGSSRHTRIPTWTADSISDLLKAHVQEVEIKAQEEIDTHKEALVRATTELELLTEENNDLVQFKQICKDERAKAMSSNKRCKEMHQKVVKLGKNIKGLYGDTEYLKTKHLSFDESIGELRSGLKKLHDNGGNEQPRKEEPSLARKTSIENGQRIELLQQELKEQVREKQRTEQQLHTKSAELTEERNSKIHLEQQLSNEQENNRQLAANATSIEAKMESVVGVHQASLLSSLQQQAQPWRDEVKRWISAIEEKLGSVPCPEGLTNKLEASLISKLEVMTKSNNECIAFNSKKQDKHHETMLQLIVDLSSDLYGRLDALKEEKVQAQKIEKLRAANQALDLEKRDLQRQMQELKQANLLAVTQRVQSSSPSITTYHDAHQSPLPNPQPVRDGHTSAVVEKFQLAVGSTSRCDRVQNSSGLDVPDMLEDSDSPDSPQAFSVVAETPTRPPPSNNQANMKTKIARGRPTSGSVNHTDELLDPFGSTGVRTPKLTNAHGMDRRASAVSERPSQPHVSRRKRSGRDAKLQSVRDTPVKALKLGEVPKQSKSKKGTQAETTAHFNNLGR